MGGKPSIAPKANVPNTDKKFRMSDEHLVEQSKQDLAKSHQGDKLAPHYGQDGTEESERATAT